MRVFFLSAHTKKIIGILGPTTRLNICSLEVVYVYYNPSRTTEHLSPGVIYYVHSYISYGHPQTEFHDRWVQVKKKNQLK